MHQLRSFATGTVLAAAGGSALLAGATGYLGGLTLQRLLSHCPGLQRVYVLARSRRGTGAGERVRKLLSGELFADVRRLGADAKVGAWG